MKNVGLCKYIYKPSEKKLVVSWDKEGKLKKKEKLLT